MDFFGRPRRKLHLYLAYVGVAMLIFSCFILSSDSTHLARLLPSQASLAGLPHFGDSPGEQKQDLITAGSPPRDRAANSTLGFEKLLVLSHRPSWRTRGLVAAAKLTGLDFTIPPQPPNIDKVIEDFRMASEPGDKTRPGLGSATAWLAHLDMLKHIIASDLETAFVVEDDVDWDVRIKDQMKLISDGVRAFRNTSAIPDFDADADAMYPYGQDWDVLWLGHCGTIGFKEDGVHREPIQFLDDTRVTGDDFTGWSKKYFLEDVPEGHRVIHWSAMTICTFGYGVTRKGAYNVLAALSEGNNEAFDVSLHANCRDGRLRCLAVSPTVFHHYEPDPNHGYVSPVKEADGKGKAHDEAEFEGYMGTTANIVESARCKALWDTTCLRKP